MKPTVYIETTVISYLTAWPSRDLIRAAQQQQTHEWWKLRDRYELLTSDLVITEASAGDRKAAAERLEILQYLTKAAVTDDAEHLAARLIRQLKLPPRAHPDALHVAIAAANGIDFLLTWNCRHLLNAVLRPLIEDVCRSNGFWPPTICTPPDLMEPMP